MDGNNSLPSRQLGIMFVVIGRVYLHGINCMLGVMPLLKTKQVGCLVQLSAPKPRNRLLQNKHIGQMFKLSENPCCYGFPNICLKKTLTPFY